MQVDYLTGESEFKTKEEMLQHFDNQTNLDLLRKQVDTVDIDFNTIIVPVLGEVAAGQPIFVQENYIDYEFIPKDWTKSGDYFGLKIKGDSMSPRISEGDTVIVTINGDEATCKRLMKYADGISLISFNPAYEPMTFSNKEIEEKPVRIIGKVIENRSKF